MDKLRFYQLTKLRVTKLKIKRDILCRLFLSVLSPFQVPIISDTAQVESSQTTAF